MRSSRVASFGQFVFVPLGQEFIAAYGWQTALVMIGSCSFAGVILASLPVVIAYVFLQRYFVAGITAGASKG